MQPNTAAAAPGVCALIMTPGFGIFRESAAILKKSAPFSTR
jgi:hypothetical protein